MTIAADDPSAADSFIVGGIICLAFLAIGVAMLWQGVREARITSRLRDHGVRTTATVISHERGPTVDRPVFGYTDQHRARFTLEPKKNQTTFTPIGAKADVLYLPEEPQIARLAATEGTPLKAATTRVVVGTVFFLLSIVLAVVLFGPSLTNGAVRIEPPTFQFALTPLLLAFPLWRIARVGWLLWTGIRTEGVVVRKSDQSKGSWLVDFVDHHGRRIQFTSMHVPGHAGMRIPVVYPRDRPQKAEVGSLPRAIRANLFVLVIALLMSVLVYSFPVYR